MCTCKSSHKIKSILQLYKYWWFGDVWSFFPLAFHICWAINRCEYFMYVGWCSFLCVCVVHFMHGLWLQFHIRAMFYCISLCRLIIHSFAINFHVIQKECMECTRLARHFFAIQNYHSTFFATLIFLMRTMECVVCLRSLQMNHFNLRFAFAICWC